MYNQSIQQPAPGPFYPFIGGMTMSRGNFPVSNQTTSLYVGNLDILITEETLFSVFSKYGAIHSLKIPRDRGTKKPRGFAYINFFNPTQAENARMLLQYEKIGRKEIRIMYKQDPRANLQANLFVREIDKSVSVKDLYNHFNKIGKVISAQIATDRNNNSLGYGYIQYEKLEDANKAIVEHQMIEDANRPRVELIKLKEKELVVELFKPKAYRNQVTSDCNLFIQNLPQDAKKEDIESTLKKAFGTHGSIVSFAYYQGKAFVCFESRDQAEKAERELNGKILEGFTEPIFVNFHISRFERNQENKTNLFLKNLRLDVNDQDLKAAFSIYGPIGSCKVKRVSHKEKDHLMGFVDFQNPQDAQNAINYGHDESGIKALFIRDDLIYINLKMTKEQKLEFLKMQKNLKKYKSYNSHLQVQPAQFNNPRYFNTIYTAELQYQSQHQPPYQTQYQPQYQPQYQIPHNPQSSHQQRHPVANQNTYPRNNGMPGYKGPRIQMETRRRPPQQSNPTRQMQMSNNPRPRTNQISTERPRNIPTNNTSVPIQSQQANVNAESGLTVETLKSKLNEFLKLDTDKQRNILGELLYPKVLKNAGPTNAPKITGMLVDFEVLTVQDILEMLEDEKILLERIEEADQLIKEESMN